MDPPQLKNNQNDAQNLSAEYNEITIDDDDQSEGKPIKFNYPLPTRNVRDIMKILTTLKSICPSKFDLDSLGYDAPAKTDLDIAFSPPTNKADKKYRGNIVIYESTMDRLRDKKVWICDNIIEVVGHM